jgi:putative two-component system hydrogenase maturation factor HypX/HoxX
MRLLFLTHGFNSLTQRLFAELTADGHEISIEYDIADSVAEEAVALYRPDVIVAPYLRRAIPESIWANHLCLVVHPGIVGDRGPSALDWAIQNDEAMWGVTVLQANAAMDGGDIWANEDFPMRGAAKGSLYRNEVTDAAVHAVRAALAQVPEWQVGRWQPTPLAAVEHAPGQARSLMKQADRALDWATMTRAEIVTRINAADGFPGVADSLFGQPCHLFDAHPENTLTGPPGTVIARREGALLRATIDGGVWIGHVKRGGGFPNPFKLPATLAFAAEAATLPAEALPVNWQPVAGSWQDIAYSEADGIGTLRFAFYNGAMSTDQCRRLIAAYRHAVSRPTRVIVLAGGDDFWSNGIHLNVIEAATSPSDESWANINAIDDLAREIIETTSHLTVAAVAGNCGAGGCFLARAADFVWAREGVIFNPHYKNMGNLYGSEYWTYLLPPRVGEAGARALMQDRLPLSAVRALALGFIDAALPAERHAFAAAVTAAALSLHSVAPQALADKRAQRAADEAAKPLATYRAEELEHMQRNFYGFDPSYHVARYHFVLKSLPSWTPRHLARHRDLGWQTPA